MSKAVEDVIAERNRQVLDLNWTAEHDDNYNTDYELIKSAVVYAEGATAHPTAYEYRKSDRHPAAPRSRRLGSSSGRISGM